MKKTKKLISILLSVLMLLSITSGLNFSAYAEENNDFGYTISGSTAEITGYYGDGGKVIIPSTIDGCKVTTLAMQAFSGYTGITSITIPDSVVNIGAAVFGFSDTISEIIVDENNPVYDSRDNCNAIVETKTNKIIAGCMNTVIPESVTTIGAQAFEGCVSLYSITIPDNVTSIEGWAFYGCWSLSSITLPNSITTIDEDVFRECYNLMSITIPNSVTYIAPEAFRECTSLSSIIIPNSVDFIDFYVFSHCTNLKSVTISNSMTLISPCTFEYCGLENIVLPDSVQRICWDAFLGCNNLTDIYYTGSEEQWNNIEIDKEHYNWGENVNDDNVSGNICFENATVHYNYVPTCSHINISSQVIQPTCTTGGYTLNTCNDCGYEYNSDETSALGHLFENYTAVDGQNHKAICSRENCNEVDINSHNFVGDTCKVCGYATVDTTAYDDALAEANAIMGASDYTTKYLASSRTAYENAVNAAIRDDFLTQEEADSAASAIISAKSLLTYSQSTVDFYIVDENGNITNQISETVSYGDVLTLNAGDYISDSDQITKWVAISGVNSNESKVATSQRSYTMVVTKPVKIYAHYVTISAEPTVKYSRITFIGKNGCVIEVKYVKEGEALDTSTVKAPVIPFYEFIGWNKSSVTANGSDIFVKANYKFIETEEDKCKVHYVQNGNIIVKSYAYDSFVYIYGAEDKKLALSTNGTTAGIITYLDENAFYAPHCSDIYVIEVEEMNSSIGITGSYSYVTDENKIAAFNCKAYLPEGFTLVECGLIASSENGSMKVEAESVSPRGEYCIEILLDKNTQITAVKGKAYLVFKNSSGDLVTIESDEITQSL